MITKSNLIVESGLWAVHTQLFRDMLMPLTCMMQMVAPEQFDQKGYQFRIQ